MNDHTISDSKPKIHVEKLVKIYGPSPHHALALLRQGGDRHSIQQETGNILGITDVTFSVAEGELFVIMGLSGSGKSTLVRCINGLIQPTSGHVLIDGEDVAHANEKRIRDIRRSKVAMVFQRFGLFPHKTVAENVEYGLKVQGLATDERRQKALDTLEVVGLRQWADYAPSSLSGGMQQRVGLARALATDAPILLMDEAFGALDPLIRRDMQDELIRLQSELKKTVVFISHDIQEALRIGDRVAIMKDGYIVQIGTPEEVVTQPVNSYIRDFVKDVNRAQVLKTGTIMRKTMPLILGEVNASGALDLLRNHQRKRAYVVNRQRQPVGWVMRSQLEHCVEQGNDDITQMMHSQFPQVSPDVSLESVFHLCQDGVPLAVVGDDQTLKGVVEQADIFANIGMIAAETNSDRAIATPATAESADSSSPPTPNELSGASSSEASDSDHSQQAVV